tara:strand:+ start:5669 stop:6862 length:1194 start_codon:yes stop_codon:yes gene_type:complete
MNKRIIIIGAGIVGLAICRELLLSGFKKVTIIEKEKSIASHQSSRNSGVMHSGLYYQPGSLKAKLSREGICYMKSYCINKKINFEECGKIVIAKNKQELPYLEKLFEKGKKNKLKGLKKISFKDINKIEPYVQGISGILVPEESIVSYREVADKFLEDILSLGGELFLNTKIVKLEENNDYKILFSSKKERFEGDIIISSSGLYSDKVSEYLGFRTNDKKIIPFRGEYYCLKNEYRYFVNNLIYPVPDPKFPFLGVHFTRLINGEVEAGPNAVLALAREGYEWNKINLSELTESLNFPGLRNFIFKHPMVTVNEFLRSINKNIFINSLKEFIPELRSDMFIKGESGVRAQLMDISGNLIQDFVILNKNNCISILNAPSPAATSSLAIAKYVVAFLNK